MQRSWIKSEIFFFNFNLLFFVFFNLFFILYENMI